jgi:hypothetical protein
MAARANNFDLVRNSFTVSAAVFFLFRSDADAGGIGAFFGDGSHGVSPSRASVVEPGEAHAFTMPESGQRMASSLENFK